MDPESIARQFENESTPGKVMRYFYVFQLPGRFVGDVREDPIRGDAARAKGLSGRDGHQWGFLK